MRNRFISLFFCLVSVASAQSVVPEVIIVEEDSQNVEEAVVLIAEKVLQVTNDQNAQEPQADQVVEIGEVKVPTSQQGKVEKRPIGEVTINVRESGVVVVDGKQITHEELKQKMLRLSAAFENQPVRLRGDEDCKWQDVVKVVDVCREGGIWNFSFATQLPE